MCETIESRGNLAVNDVVYTERRHRGRHLLQFLRAIVIIPLECCAELSLSSAELITQDLRRVENGRGAGMAVERGAVGKSPQTLLDKMRVG